MDSPLRERARLGDISWGDEISGVRMARTGAVFCGLGALFGFLSAALPDTVVQDQNLLLLVAVLTAALGMALFAAQDRIPVRAFHAVVVAGTALAGVAVYAWGTGSAYVPLPFLWVTLFAFYFFPLRAALVHMALVGVAYAIVLSAEDHSGTRVDGWVATVGTLLVAGVFVALLRDRLVGTIHSLSQVADHDPLTQLLNRRGFQDTFDTELERARRSNAPLSLVVGDLDGLARVNAELGRAEGDEALRHVAGAFLAAKRSFDSAARVGGEEFALLAPDCDEHGAYMIAERVRMDTAAGPGGLTISFGVATFPSHGRSAETLLRAADQALQAAKSLGCDRTVISSAEVSAPATPTRRGGSDARVRLAALLSIAEALDVRDMGSASHCHRVSRFAELTARELGLPPDTVERVRLAGMLHDVGRIGTPDQVAHKPGPLDAADWVWVRAHPEVGARMVETTDFDDIRTWILFHHERPDGRGYPAGLDAAGLPVESRILAVSDAYEAMTSDRPHRSAMSPERAASELRDAAGGQFDGEVVEALLRVV